MGGFGLSRYKLDDLLFREAERLGVNFFFEKVTEISFRHDRFNLTTSANEVYEAPIAIAAYGKRSNLDQKLNRPFFYHRSPYMGVKYHILCDQPDDLVRLDNFSGGYCGVCKIEDNKYNLCYLSKNIQLKRFSGISEMEEQVLFKNQFIRSIFQTSQFLFDKPEIINEISFESKALVENHLLFCGDSAGMISPLCGNGMAMAIHSGKILAETIIQFGSKGESLWRELLEKNYILKWNREFAFRLKTGKIIQKMFGRPGVSNLCISMFHTFPFLTEMMIKKTHGKVFI
jgi:flavin-dependent dehydrogenase